MWKGDYGFLLRKLVLRDFKVRYRKMSLGVFWSLLNPIVTVSILTFVFTKVLPPNIPNFPVFAMCGLVPFSFFTQTWGMSTSSLVENASLVKHVLLPRQLIPIASVLANCIHLLMQFALLLALSLWFGGEITAVWLWLPVLAVLEILFVCGLTLISSALHVYVRDTRYAVESVNTVLFWVVPIFYSFSSIPAKYQNVYQYNPLAALTLALRNILLDARSPADSLLMKLTAVSVVTFALGWFFFGRMKARFYDSL
jgi:ABC-type polysaccharide/polyol phosphate export permease